ncbi:MAG: SBBP repeat-containing protein [Syntrophobacteraceae bacterium]|nr:SBBP repeat-containing protein [Syntrophobacteraceae bacterium]
MRYPRGKVLPIGFTFCVCLVLAAALPPCCGAAFRSGVGIHEVTGNAGSFPSQPVRAQKSFTARVGFGRLPLYFIANRGQVNREAEFYEAGPGHAMFFTRKGIVLGLEKRESHRASGRKSDRSQVFPERSRDRRAADVRASYLGIGMVGMNRDVQIAPEAPQPGKVNYLIGHDPRKWRTGIPTYKAVLYRNAYPGIDIKFYGNNSRLEYDVIVAPGANPSLVKFRYSGAKDVRVAKNGDLSIDFAGGSIVQQKPLVYQLVGGRRVARSGSFKVEEEGGASRAKRSAARFPATLRTFTCGFHLGPYDRSAPLVVDPTIVYATYLGGSGDDNATGIAVDASGNAYVTGWTFPPDFPVTAGALQTGMNGAANAFVTKIAAGGAALVYSTYLGGSDEDLASGVAIDASGNAYVTGVTYSSDFPVTPGAFQATLKSTSGNAFAAEISPDGANLIYSTFLGGSTGNGDFATAMAIDGLGNAYVAGQTLSTDFPVTKGAFQTTLQSPWGNAFVAEIAAGGSRLVYSTCLGGSGQQGQHSGDQANGIATDSSGNAYITGYTTSADFPVSPGAFQTSMKGSRNAFAAEVAAGGAGLVYSTYLGGGGQNSPYQGDVAYGIAIDASKNAYVTGVTYSTDYPVTAGAFQTRGNIFVTEIAAGGASLVYSTCFGGSNINDFSNAIAIDGSGNAYVTGGTSSTDFPVTAGAFQTRLKGDMNGFLTELSPGGASLVFSSYLGGTSVDWANGIAIASSGNAYITGYTSSVDFPVTAGAFQTTPKSTDQSSFVAELPLFVSGICGSSSGGSFSVAPSSSLCGSGTASSVARGSNTWGWSCAGQYGGESASCVAAIRIVDGACGSANGGAFFTVPVSNLCGAGTATTVTGSGPWGWSCVGLNGGATASCSAVIEVNGACGNSSGASFSTAPASNLCGSGAASPVTGSGPWGWSCAGQNGGATANCSATLLINGACGSSSGASFSTTPASDLCVSGAASPVTGSGPWGWSCAGQNGGATANCSASLLINGACGSSNGASFSTAPASDLCDSGAASPVSGSGPWGWSCAGQNGGAAANCSASLLIDGACGSSNGASFSTEPASDLCVSGAASPVSGSGPWGWSCAGINGGAAASCLANVSLPQSLWKNASDLGGGWEWLSWFGRFNTGCSPWIYHAQHGWLYPYGTSIDSIWFYDSAMGGFWWTSATVYPYVYRASDGAWLYYVVGSSKPRWFFNFSTNSWESH